MAYCKPSFVERRTDEDRITTHLGNFIIFQVPWNKLIQRVLHLPRPPVILSRRMFCRAFGLVVKTEKLETRFDRKRQETFYS